MANAKPEPKAAIKKLVSYRPDVSAPATGQGAERIIRLSVNEGALGTSPRALEALADFAKSPAHRYPEQVSRDLVEAIADVHGLDIDAARILPANGSDEIFALLAHAYLEPGDEAVITQYGFLVFPQAVRIAGGVPVFADDDDTLTASVDNILKAVTPKTKIVFLANPNNPTGSMLPRDAIARLIKNLRGDIVLVIDSAYSEYVTAPDYTAGAEFVLRHDNVIMTRTFSKIHGLAALRLGWAYLPRAIYDVLAAVRAPFSVNTAAAIAGVAAIRDRDFIQKSIAHNAEWLPRMRESIIQAGFDALPGVANFFLVRFADGDAAMAAKDFFDARGILLRGMQPYGLDDCLRMSIGTEEEMEITAAAFKDLAAAMPHAKRSVS